MRNYTESQKKAIYDRGHTLLVSAAAGSGKTSVLIERIISRITDPDDPFSLDNILCVTFTKSAAAQIKERLAAALTEAASKAPENRRLIRQLALLDSADIETIDSFFLDVIKKNFDKASLPAAFGVCDEQTAQQMREEACRKVLDEYYENEKEGSAFFRFIENFSSMRDDGDAAAFISELYSSVLSLVDPFGFLEESVKIYSDIAKGELDYMDSPWGKGIRRELSLSAEHFSHLLADCLQTIDSTPELEGYRGNIACYHKFASNILQNAENGGYELIRSLFDIGEVPSLGGARKAPAEIREEIKAVRDNAKSKFENLQRTFFQNTQEELRSHAGDCAGILATALEIFKKLDNELFERKKEKGKIHFSDMSRICFSLLLEKRDGKFVPTELCKTVASRYREIYVDEYQDTNSLQDGIFNALCSCSGADRFMVGDVKQCIYAFRNSEPELFVSYYDSFEPIDSGDGKCKKILLRENFRSDSPVTDFANAVFGGIMQRRLGNIDYDSDAALIHGKSEEKNSPSVLLCCPVDEKASADDKTAAQAKAVASKIASLIANEGYEPSDIAVLLRTKSGMGVVKKALDSLNVPVCDPGDGSFYEKPHVSILLSALHGIENPSNDIYLAGAMCSPIFGFELSELIKMRLEGSGSLYDAVCAYAEKDERAQDFVKKLTELRRLASAMGTEALIDEICRLGDFERSLGLLPGGEGYIEDIYRLRFLADPAEELSDFLSRVERTKELSSDKTSDGGVALCTIHKSKGLEYKVCFVIGLEKEIGRIPLTEKVYMPKGLPPSFALRHISGFGKIDTAMLNCARYFEKHTPMAEEVRIFYVAMTRAKERLYLCFGASEGELSKLVTKVESSEEPCKPYLIYNSSTRLEWVLRALLRNLGKEGLDSLVFTGACPKAPYLLFQRAKAQSSAALSEKSSLPAVMGDADYRYPHIERSRIPTKLSVSELSDSEDAHSLSPVAYKEASKPLPAFLGGDESGAAKGTAMHAFMQFCDFSKAEKDVFEEAKRMKELYFLTERQTELLDFEKLSRFFESELYREIKKAKRIYREQRYNLKMPAAAFSGREGLSDETVLVQGVIDCFFETEDSRMILLDFKTDRIRQNEKKLLCDRYGFQVRRYAEAVKAMAGIAPEKAYLYSFALSEAVEVPLDAEDETIFF